MKIGIIGAGQIGGMLARLTKLGHNVSIASSRGPASLATLAVETGDARGGSPYMNHGATR